MGPDRRRWTAPGVDVEPTARRSVRNERCPPWSQTSQLEHPDIVIRIARRAKVVVKLWMTLVAVDGEMTAATRHCY